MLELKFNIFRELKNLEVGQLHFQKIVIFGNNVKKNQKKGILALFGRAQWDTEVAQLQKF